MTTDPEPSGGSTGTGGRKKTNGFCKVEVQCYVCKGGPAWRMGGHLSYGGRCWGSTPCFFSFQINDLFSFL